MSRELIFLPAASEDFVEGKNYYEQLSPGKGGARFEDAFKEAIKDGRSRTPLPFSISIASIYVSFHTPCTIALLEKRQ